MIHFLQGALVFIVGVAIAGGLAIAVGGPAAPCLAIVFGCPFGVLAVHVATRR